VEFTDELNHDAEHVQESNQQQKLHRRDTPHHLKNKRIINKNNDSITLDVKKTNFAFFCTFNNELYFSKLCRIVQLNHR
jgi:hypothetical protein